MAISHILGTAVANVSHFLGTAKANVTAILGAAAGFTVPVAFTDDFNDNSIDPLKWTATPSTDIAVSETSSEMRFIADASYSGGLNVASLVSAPAMDFTGKTVDVEFPTTARIGHNFVGFNSSGGTVMIVRDTANGNNYAATFVEQDNMLYRRSNNGTNSQLSTANGLNHLKWRINHDNSNNTWRFYTWNGSSWVLYFTSAAAAWNPTSVRIELQCYVYGSNQQSRSTRFDNLISDATY